MKTNPGERYARLLVLARIDDHITPAGVPHARYRCRCDCGKVVDVLGSALRGKAGYRTRSCGCWKASGAGKRGRAYNRVLTVNGVTMCVAEWAEATGISASAIRGRLFRGWTPERAVSA